MPALIAGLTYRNAAPTGEDLALTEELGGIARAATFVVFGAAVRRACCRLVGLDSGRVPGAQPDGCADPAVAVALRQGTGTQLPTVAFLGWFGPRGLTSIIFTVVVPENSAVPHVHAITAHRSSSRSCCRCSPTD